MPVFKNEDNGTWYVMARYVNWKGERRQKCKRGFATKKEAQEWESEGEHMADKGAYHPHEDTSVFRKVKD